MNKVMTRTQHRPGTRPPTRRDTRRPGSTPPRIPSGGAPRTTSPDGRPPGSPGTTGLHARTRPADTRPPTATAPTPALKPSHAHTPTGRPAPYSPAVPQLRPTDVFADRLLLVLSGQRPVHSMLRHTAGRAYDDLAWLAERSPLRTHGTRPVVRDIGFFEPRPGAVEAFARIGAGTQLRAMAFRLEQGGDLRWRCTAVELGGPRRPHKDDD
ncbi:Rv3235 family protein [Streptomyces sp. NPDC048581]|uniref:Rv3235 family protein n=1 Tax=unclassified Streptomyces TaxID=2593676 RepID=UPI0037178DD6